MYLKLPLIEKNVTDVRIVLCSNKIEQTVKFRIPQPEINYLGDFNSEDLFKNDFLKHLCMQKINLNIRNGRFSTIVCQRGNGNKIKSMRSGFVTTDQLYFQLKTESK